MPQESLGGAQRVETTVGWTRRVDIVRAILDFLRLRLHRRAPRDRGKDRQEPGNGAPSTIAL
ncbi:hypothetical protein GLE_4693 [Lysobacter enzymogenes]|uniref:Uncharacterized protein n=1 Tax=Lysobacter enzymogenes TaxID=69 RepID=A0A0S2DN83_LYSEN|nr:hypothetical protein GLE_4693 [Lysobacter enzymogenes]